MSTGERCERKRDEVRVLVRLSEAHVRVLLSLGLLGCGRLELGFGWEVKMAMRRGCVCLDSAL